MLCEYCKQEHDGSYGSGRFCSKSCRMKFIGSKSNKNGKLTGHKPTNIKLRSPYGTWKCRHCGEIFESKSQLWKHYHTVHKNDMGKWHSSGSIPWNKGLTVENDNRVAKGRDTLQARYNSGELKGSWVGRHHSAKTKAQMKESALRSNHQRICKTTLPYTKLDGTVVNLDSSYERKVAKFLDLNKIEWIRPEPLLWIDLNGKEHHYFPDFYLPKYDVYLDPKNDYCFNVQKEKISYIKDHYQNVIFLHKSELINLNLSMILLKRK